MVLAQDLRNAVLQAALQGRLTKQLETDSSVELQSVDNEMLSNIPENWRLIEVDTIIEIRNGFTPKRTVTEFWDKQEIPWFTVEDINEQGHTITYTKQFITNKALGNSKTRKIPKHTVLLCCTSATIGNYALTEIELTMNQQWNGLVIRDAFKENVLAEYILCWVQTLKEEMIRKGGSTTFPFLSTKKLGKFLIPLPPIEEQQRIVDRIAELMKKIDEYEKVEKELAALEQKFPDDMKNALLQAAMQGKLTEQLDSDSSVDEMLETIKKEKEQLIKEKKIKKDKRLFNTNEIVALYDIPLSWKWTTLGNLVYKLTDGTHKTPKYTDSGVKFVSVKDMSTGKLSLNNTKYISQEEHKELYERCNPEKGDILLSKVGTTGVPAIVDTDEQFSLFVSVALLKFNHKYINQKFFYYLIYSPLVQQQATENTKGIGNKNWVLDKVANTLVILPPIEEQQRIVKRLEQLLPLCETL